jgi:hypothetical protein
MNDELSLWMKSGKLSDAEKADYERQVTAMGRLGSDAEKWAHYQAKIYKYRDTLYKTSLKSWDYYTDGQVREQRRNIWLANGIYQE